MEADCFQAKELQASAFSRERATIQSECEAEVALLRAEVTACELQVRGCCVVPTVRWHAIFIIRFMVFHHDISLVMLMCLWLLLS